MKQSIEIKKIGQSSKANNICKCGTCNCEVCTCENCGCGGNA